MGRSIADNQDRSDKKKYIPLIRETGKHWRTVGWVADLTYSTDTHATSLFNLHMICMHYLDVSAGF